MWLWLLVSPGCCCRRGVAVWRKTACLGWWGLGRGCRPRRGCGLLQVCLLLRGGAVCGRAWCRVRAPGEWGLVVVLCGSSFLLGMVVGGRRSASATHGTTHRGTSFYHPPPGGDHHSQTQPTMPPTHSQVEEQHRATAPTPQGEQHNHSKPPTARQVRLEQAAINHKRQRGERPQQDGPRAESPGPSKQRRPMGDTPSTEPDPQLRLRLTATAPDPPQQPPTFGAWAVSQDTATPSDWIPPPWDTTPPAGEPQQPEHPAPWQLPAHDLGAQALERTQGTVEGETPKQTPQQPAAKGGEQRRQESLQAPEPSQE